MKKKEELLENKEILNKYRNLLRVCAEKTTKSEKTTHHFGILQQLKNVFRNEIRKNA